MKNKRSVDTTEKLDLQEKLDSENPFANCVIPLLDAMGWRGDHSLLIEALPHITTWMDLTDVLNTMANLKFESSIVPQQLDRIDHRLMPCLFITEDDKPIVLIKKAQGTVLTYQGDSAEYTQLLVTAIKGNAVYFKLMDSKNVGLNGRMPDWFYTLMMRFKGVFITVFVLTFFLNILALISPLFIMTIFDKVLVAESASTLGFLAVGIVVFILATTGFRALRTQFMSFISVRMGNIIGNQILRRIFYLPPSFTESATLGSQVARIKDFETVKDFFGGPAATTLMEIPFILFLIGGMAVMGGEIAYIPIATIAVFIAFGFAVSPFLKRANAGMVKSGARKQEFILEMLTNVRAIKYTGTSRRWTKRYKDIVADATMNSFEASKLNSIINTVTQGLISLAGVATMGIGVSLVIQNKMSAGSLIACMMLIWRILAPLQMGFSVATQTGQIKKSIDQLNRLMNLNMESKPENSMSVQKKILGIVEFNQVSIRYSPDAHPALLGVNFKINKGEIVVIVGHDGSGKSSIFKLIMGLYLPQAGRVFIDNMNVRQLDPITLRKTIAYAPKADQFFYGTIMQNLVMVNPTSTMEDVQNAAEKAGVLEDILALPEGFDTRMREHNIVQFSASLQKRLSHTRMFLKDSNLFLLDKPEKGLTIAQEEFLLNTILSLKGKSTVIAISDKEVFFDVADKVIWMEKGRVRMMGPPEKIVPEYLNHSEGN